MIFRKNRSSTILKTVIKQNFFLLINIIDVIAVYEIRGKRREKIKQKFYNVFTPTITERFNMEQFQPCNRIFCANFCRNINLKSIVSMIQGSWEFKGLLYMHIIFIQNLK